MEDYMIDACKWHIDRESKEYKARALEHFQNRYGVLLRFLKAEGLLSNEQLLPVEDWDVFELFASDLTDEGLELFRRCHGKWNPSFEHAHTERHLVQWRRRLAELRRS